MPRRLAAVILSVILLCPGWLGLSGLPLLAGFVPLLWISASYDASRRAWWHMFGWAALTFALWNICTVWWIWNATPVGPVAATLASTTVNMAAFMLFHTVSKKAPKPLAYVTLAAAWIATEYWYTIGDFSWPWLTLGNGFSHDIWAVQWYEYTGVFGGSLWVILCNILLFEALRARTLRRWIAAAAAIVLPIALSLVVRAGWKLPDEGSVTVSIIQPNVDCYDKFHGDDAWQDWTLSGVTGLLGAKYFVADLVQGNAGVLQYLLPVIIFVVAIFLAFATGTSWGTFAILVPIVCNAFPSGEMLVISIAACLSGAVCGDHCSPISDTTIMASAGAHSNHVNHVSTQLPYAMTVAAVSAVCYALAGGIEAVLGGKGGVFASLLLLVIAVVIELVVLGVLRRRFAAKETVQL